MNRLKIGLRLESLNLPLRRALQAAQRLAVAGVQVDAAGDLSPANLSQTGRREFRHLLRSHNLELTALGCPLRHGLNVAEGQEGRIDYLRQALALSFDLGPRIVLVQAGEAPEDPHDLKAARLTEALLALGQHGDRVGAVLALETGQESGARLANYLKQFDTGGLGVNINPANLLMNGFDPYESTQALHGRIVHAHAKDARISGTSHAGREVPLGHGDIDWLRYLGVLEEVAYHAWLTIEQETGDNRLADLSASVGFLRRFL